MLDPLRVIKCLCVITDLRPQRKTAAGNCRVTRARSLPEQIHHHLRRAERCLSPQLLDRQRSAHERVFSGSEPRMKGRPWKAEWGSARKWAWNECHIEIKGREDEWEGRWKSPGLSDGRMDRWMDARREGAVIISDWAAPPLPRAFH